MRIAIIGAAELGRLIAKHIENDSTNEIVGFYDDFKKDEFFLNYKIIGNVEKLLIDFEKGLFDAAIIGIGYNQMKSRAAIFDNLKGKIPFANVLHSSAYIDKSCELGEGIVVLPGVTLDLGVVIADNVLINTSTIVAHHSSIGKHSFLAPGVHIAGLVNIEEQCFIGIGSIIKDNINIKRQSIVGAGSLVLKDIEENAIYLGAPAKFIKTNF